MERAMSELWQLVWGKPEIDPAALARAIEQELHEASPDFRTRLLIRDSTEALEGYWGSQRLGEWLDKSALRTKVQTIRLEDLGERGFPSLKEQLMDRTAPESVKEYLRELGTSINESVTLEIGGAIALILGGYLTRATTDINVINEVPAAIRSQQNLLNDLQKRYGLLLTHFQSHYLPTGWEQRLNYLGDFGSIKLYSVDVCDIFLGKLFSVRAKDLDDLRSLKPNIVKDHLVKQLLTTAQDFLKEPSLKKSAEKNWYILFGEHLPA